MRRERLARTVAVAAAGCLALTTLTAAPEAGSAPPPPAEAAAGVSDPPLQVRPPTAAGSFYPSDPDELREALQKLLGRVPRSPIPGRIRAMLVPHAALDVSGPLAAMAFAQLDRSYDRVFVISVNHDRDKYFRGVWIPPYGAYRTPLGDVPVDAAARRMRGSAPFRDIEGATDAYVIENPLPFLQRTLKKFTLVPIVLGEVSDSALHTLAAKLAAQADDRTLFVFSLDLSHSYKRARARQVDEGTLRRLLSLDPRLKLGATEGNDVLRLAIFLCRRLGLRASFMGYWNSADLGLPRYWAVGYASVVFYEEDARALDLTPREWQALVTVAVRRFHAEMQSTAESPEPGRSPAVAEELQQLDAGSTLRDWRGCGLRLVAGGRILREEVDLYPSTSLLETVDELALRIGRRCRAFRCLEGEEGAPEFRLVIGQVPRRLDVGPQAASPSKTLLALLRPDWSPDRVGLLLTRGMTSGVYLGGAPMPEEALDTLCGAAGLEAGCAASPRSRLYRFGVAWSGPQSLRTNS